MEIEEFCEALVLDYIRKYNAPTDYIDIRGLITDYLGLEIEFESIVEDDETITAFIANGSRTLKIINNGKMLKEIIQDYPKAIVEFDETLFTSIVSKIKVCHDGTLIFELKGQLSLKERIEVSRKCA
jgi:hypothetical protein